MDMKKISCAVIVAAASMSAVLAADSAPAPAPASAPGAASASASAAAPGPDSSVATSTMPVLVSLVGATLVSFFSYYLQDFIPLNGGWLRKGFRLDSLCARCGKIVSLVDAWLHYSKAVEIRQLAGLDFSNLTVLNLLVLLFDSMDSAMRNKLLMTLWSIWFARNMFCWKNESVAAAAVLSFGISHCKTGDHRCSECRRWTKPPEISTMSSPSQNLEPKLVEAFAIREALSWLEALRMDGVMVESDYLQVISALKQVDKDVYDFAFCLLDAKARVAHLFTRVALSYASYS
ncbi:hypothetical protein Gotur_002890 [Gossypium turneri]